MHSSCAQEWYGLERPKDPYHLVYMRAPRYTTALIMGARAKGRTREAQRPTLHDDDFLHTKCESFPKPIGFQYSDRTIAKAELSQVGILFHTQSSSLKIFSNKKVGFRKNQRPPSIHFFKTDDSLV